MVKGGSVALSAALGAACMAGEAFGITERELYGRYNRYNRVARQNNEPSSTCFPLPIVTDLLPGLFCSEIDPEPSSSAGMADPSPGPSSSPTFPSSSPSSTPTSQSGSPSSDNSSSSPSSTPSSSSSPSSSPAGPSSNSGSDNGGSTGGGGGGDTSSSSTPSSVPPSSSGSTGDGGGQSSSPTRSREPESEPSSTPSRTPDTTTRDTDDRTTRQSSMSPATITQVTVISGIQVTQTLTVGAGINPSLVDSNSSGSGFFSNTGAVVGVFVVVGLAAAAILLGAFFFWRRRQRNKVLDEDIRIAAGGAGAGGAGTNRFGDDDDDLDDGLPGSMSQLGHGMMSTSAFDHSHSYYAVPTAGIMAPPLGAAGAGSDQTHHRSLSSGSAGQAGIGGVAGGGYWAHQQQHGMGMGSRHNSWHEAYPIPQAQGGQAPAGVGYNEYSEYLQGGGRDPFVHHQDEAAAAAGMGMGAYAGGQSEEGGSGEHDGSGGSGSGGGEHGAKRQSDVDQRLDPRTMLLRLREGNNNQSSDSLKDSNDYSRRILKVTNSTEADQ